MRGLTSFKLQELLGPLVVVAALSTAVGALSASLELAVQFALCNLVDRKSTRLNSSHVSESRMPSSA